MFSFLRSNGFVESPIDYKTGYSELSYKELSDIRIAKKKSNEVGCINNLEEIDKELVLRSFDVILGMGADVSKAQAISLCSHHLEIKPYNDFLPLS